jgi:hypothetical protein
VRSSVLAFGTARSRYSGDIQKRTSAARLPADILTDETVILEIKAVPALLPAHDTQLQTYLRMSGLPVACYSTSMRFIRKMALGDSSDEGFFFSVAPRGPRSAFVLKNPWPNTNSGIKWQDTEQQYNDHVRRLESFVLKNPWPNTHSGIKWQDTEPPNNVQPPEPSKCPGCVRSTRTRTSVLDGQPINFNDAGHRLFGLPAPEVGRKMRRPSGAGHRSWDLTAALPPLGPEYAPTGGRAPAPGRLMPT